MSSHQADVPFSPVSQDSSDTTVLVPGSSVTSKKSSELEPSHQASSSLFLTQQNQQSAGNSGDNILETDLSQGESLLDNTDRRQPRYERLPSKQTNNYRRHLTSNRFETKSWLTFYRMATSIEDISSLRLWKGVVAEFLGTLLLTLVGCGSCINLQGKDNSTSPIVQIAMCFGLSVATIVWAIGHVSGGHINPAVTIALLATRKISLAKAIFFVLCQLLGAVVGAGLLFGLTPHSYHGNLGMTKVSDKINLGQAAGVEFFITFVLVFTVFASCDSKRKDLNGSTPLTIGLSVTMCHLWAIDFTGSSMNTARSFGPALVMGKWENHWVYWIGPIFGGVIAGLLYEHLFAVNASLSKVKACILTSNYDDEKYKASKVKIRIIEEDSINEANDELPLTERDDKFTSKV